MSTIKFPINKKKETTTMTTRLPICDKEKLKKMAKDHDTDLNTFVKSALEFAIVSDELKKRAKK